jgi:hypothetical protein
MRSTRAAGSTSSPKRTGVSNSLFSDGAMMTWVRARRVAATKAASPSGSASDRQVRCRALYTEVEPHQ